MENLESPTATYDALEQRLGYRFSDVANCECALTHKSWMNERPGAARRHNERFEFLGDAVLALVVSDLLMKRFPGQEEGELSKRRAALVNEAGLARVAEDLGLGQWIFLGRGEEQARGRAKRSILANAFEAVIGAVFLDGGFESAYRVTERLFSPGLADAEAVAGRDFKSKLQELSQSRLQLAPIYTVLSQSGPEHDKTFDVAIFLGETEYGRARGKSKKEAQQNAAALAITLLESQFAVFDPPPRSQG